MPTDTGDCDDDVGGVVMRVHTEHTLNGSEPRLLQASGHGGETK